MNFMDVALKEAVIAKNLNEVPVGAVIVKDGEVIAKAHNLRETTNSPLAHAEILAIEEAARRLGNWRLNRCELYVTLEPCPMCAGAILQSRIGKVFIGTFDPNSGAAGSVINILQNNNLNFITSVKWCYDERCSKILRDFFKERR
ncbi:nucleoside deaminase [Clostridium fallax]|uniref:tRNA-specific adenosine deaminase n=1 Tax=Clostridium fallax TaxID=1533 RepID=A0A1M4W3V4_9CLOT|nr:nucleoside deaminase [Clostridium fallax]SHE75835.1 tRNA-adenosine deaminase [Clostridium fallax]SQB22863.1 cytidine/deoxycytidylate deaminase [Clostridium fallax]